MIKLFLAITVLMLLSNRDPSTYTVHFSNRSGKTFDSVVVLVTSTRGNNSKIKFTGVKPGQDVKESIDAMVINAKHDIAVSSTLYAKDTVIKDFGCYNDLGVFNAHYQISVDSVLHTRCKEWD